MMTFTQLVNDYLSFTKDKTTENRDWGGSQINSSIKARLGEKDWVFLEKTTTALTVANQQTYTLPADCGQLRTITISQGTTIWSLIEAPSRQFWNMLNTVSYKSSIAQYYYRIDNKVLIYPTPSSSGNTITYNFKKKTPKLSVADYSTGTVSITSNDETVTGAGGAVFTAAMPGLGLMTTDGYWYTIGSFTSSTVLELVEKYIGQSTSGATYTIGQLSVLPDAYEELPVYDACADYFLKEGNFEKSKGFRGMADELALKMRSEQGSKSTSPRIRSGMPENLNPNLYTQL